ncbi:MAG: class B sortase [Lachnospiraceae bacterium]|nr:class B sortase [Lachnospiraceae bacterium]
MKKKYLIIASIAVIAVTMLACVFIINKNNKEDLSSADTPAPQESDGGDDAWTGDLTDEDNRELLDAYKIMKEDNPDFAGYLMVVGTNVAYPVMYSPEDPEKYLHKDLNGLESHGGLPFIDTRCNIEPDSDNIIIYGHNMKDGSKFSSLIDYQDKAFYEDHKIIRYDTTDEVREYEVMAVFYDKVYYIDEDVFKFYDFIDAGDEYDYEDNVNEYLKRSIYDTGVRAVYGDKLITLVTCSYHTENGRFVVVARRKG